MGAIYKLNCEKCGYEFEAFLGSSGFFNYDEQILNNVLNGKYGEQLQKLARDDQVSIITLGKYFLIKCRDCGYFEVVPKLWITRKDDDSDSEYQYKCRICGGEVERFDYFDKRFNQDQNIKFECPNCHEELVVMWAGTWD